MKALLVADNETAIENISTVLKTAGYDTIIYRWLLKALDNIEEIAPHLIVISTKDYPRHWKTMTSFVQSGIGGTVPQVILYTPEDFSADEKKKAEALGVRGTFDNVGVDGLDQLRAILEKHDDIYSGKLDETKTAETIAPESAVKETNENGTPVESDEDDSVIEVNDVINNTHLADDTVDKSTPADDAINNTNASDNAINNTVVESDAINDTTAAGIVSDEKINSEENNESSIMTLRCTFIFTNPQNGCLITGTSRNYDGSSLEFMPDIPEQTETICDGCAIENASIKTEDSIQSVHAEVTKVENQKLLISLRPA